MVPKLDNKGFTLLEILVTLFIFGIILSVIFSTYTGGLSLMEETESRSRIYAMARIALQRIHQDLEACYATRSGTAPSTQEEKDALLFVGEDRDINGRPADTLRFLSLSHLLFDEEEENPGIGEITFFVREKDEEKGLLLYRSDKGLFSERVEEEKRGHILCEGLYSVDLTYCDSSGELYQNWDSTQGEFKGKLPARIIIALEFLDETQPETPLRFITAVALPLARGEYGKAS